MPKLQQYDGAVESASIANFKNRSGSGFFILLLRLAICRKCVGLNKK
jgi:hypothetical protein